MIVNPTHWTAWHGRLHAMLDAIDAGLAEAEQDGLALRVLDAGAAWAEVASIALPARVAMTAMLPGGQGVAALLDDGRVVEVGTA